MKKNIVLHIPIPSNDKVSWGINSNQYVKMGDFPEAFYKNIDELKVDCSKYSDLEEYLLDCIWISIKFCFEKGFTINGVKIKDIIF